MKRTVHNAARRNTAGRTKKPHSKLVTLLTASFATFALMAGVLPAAAAPGPDEGLGTGEGISTTETQPADSDVNDVPANPPSEAPEGESTPTPEAVPAPAENGSATAEEEVTPTPAADGDDRVVPRSEYELIAVSSEAPYGNEGDGTGAAALSDNAGHMWSVKYGIAGPHWLAFDTGAERTLLGFQYLNKQTNGHVDQYRIYATNNKQVLLDPSDFSLWGDPVLEGSFQEAYTAQGGSGKTYEARFTEPVRGRYILFEPISTVTGSNAEPGVTFINVIDVEGEEEYPSGPVVGEATPIPLSVGNFRVNVAEEFPQVIDYGFADSAQTLAGRSTIIPQFTINGSDYAVETTVLSQDSEKVSYRSTVSEDGTFKGLQIDSTIEIEEPGTVTFTITGITGTAEASVNTIAIPGHRLVSVTEDNSSATLSRTAIATDPRTNADVHTNIDAAAVTGSWNTPYGFISNGSLAAGLYSNATKQANATNTDQRLLAQIFTDDQGKKAASLQAGAWVWHPTGVADSRVTTYQNPMAQVVVAAPSDGQSASWQDAAVALRDVIPENPGADRVPERVAQRIPFNFGSEATNPFLKTLDNIKKVALATDGLGQWTLLKGYGSEGHDSANTDYGGHYNTGAGGIEDLKTLTELGAQWNTNFGVHVNATEVYHNARSFSDYSTDNGRSLGWGWLNQSYYINQTKDLGLLGAPSDYVGVIDRFQQLKDEVPNLDTVYIDVWYSSGWVPEALAEQLHNMGWEVASEWSFSFEGSSIWSHWSNDKPYGASAYNKGLNSQMVRFMFNTERDMWNQDKLLGGLNMLDFEGWAAKDDWTAYKKSLWTDSLPTKYLQHFEVEQWESGVRAILSDDVEITMDGNNRSVTQNGVEVLRSTWNPSASNPAYDGHTNNVYLLPWQDVDSDSQGSPLNADKMYYFNQNGGNATFQLTDRFAGTTNFELFKLTDLGRSKVADVTASGGSVTLNGEAGVPYVLVPSGAIPTVSDPNWGEGSGLNDPGFNAGNLDAWNAEGDAWVLDDAKGSLAQLGAGATQLSQEISVEAGKTYALSAMVGMGWGEREFTMSAQGQGVDASRTITTTPARNYVASEPRHNSQMQRATIEFTPTSSGTVTVTFAAGAGTQVVSLEDVRLQEVRSLTEQYVEWGETPIAAQVDSVPADALFWNFEDNQPGYGPFVRGDASGATGDGHTSVAELHYPYSQKEWKNNHTPFNTGTVNGWGTDDVLSGTRSLKSHDESKGLVYRTVPAKVDFQEGHKYRVSFSYQSSHSAAYSWILGVDDVAKGASGTKTISSEGLAQALDTTRYVHEFVAGSDSPWVGLYSNGVTNADLVVDEFMVEDLGETEDLPVLGNVEIGAGTFDRGSSNTLTTTFTNNHTEAATNVYTTIEGLPDGWTAKLVADNGNLIANVAPGANAKTQWLIDVPEDADLGSVELRAVTKYAVNCKDLEVATKHAVTVAGRPSIAAADMNAYASSSQSGEGIDKALDGNPSTQWHTAWSDTTPHPHYAWFDLRESKEIDGFGYQHRQNGVNGKIQNYAIYGTNDSSLWANRVAMKGTWDGAAGVTKLASGTFQAANLDMQIIDFASGNYRYVIFEAKSAQTQDTGVYSSAAELRIYTNVAAYRDGFEVKDRPVTDPEPCLPAPSTLITVDPAAANGQNGWYTTAPNVTISTDGGESASIWYRVGTTGDFVQYMDGVPSAALTEGEVTIEAYAQRGEADPGETVSVTLKIDTAAPSVSGQVNATERTVTLSAEDATSGLASIEYSIGDSDEWQFYTGPISAPAEGITLSARATDMAGNVSEPVGPFSLEAEGGEDVDTPSAVITVDPEAPNGTNGWYTSPPRVTISAGVTRELLQAWYRIGTTGEFALYDGEIPASVFKDGDVTIQAYMQRDGGDPGKITTLTLRLDTKAPEPKASIDKDNRQISLAASDATSGLASIEYSIGDSGEWQFYTAPVKAPAEGLSLKVRATDQAGNVSEVAGPFTIDAKGTPGTPDPGDGGNGTPTKPVTPTKPGTLPKVGGTIAIAGVLGLALLGLGMAVRSRRRTQQG